MQMNWLGAQYTHREYASAMARDILMGDSN